MGVAACRRRGPPGGTAALSTRGILVIKLGALGDVIMATGLVRRIQGAHAGERLALLTAPEYAALFQHWDGLEIAAFPRRGWRATWRALRWIRAGCFRRIYDLQSNDRSALLCALSGAPERVGNHPRFPWTHHPPDPYRGQSHIHARWMEVLRGAGLSVAPDPPCLPLPAGGAAEIRRWMRGRGLGARAFVILHAGASAAHPEKCWPHFAALAAELRRAGLRVLWTGADSDRQRNRALAAPEDVDAAGLLSLAELAALGAAARFAVTNDSAPMHALSASGIPVYGLFGPTDWRRNHAIGQRDRVLSRSPGTGPFKPTSLEELSVDVVMDRLRGDRVLP